MDWMTPATIQKAVEKFNEFEQEKHKQGLRNARLIGFYFAVSMGAAIKSPEEMGTFEFEKQEIKKGKIIEWPKDQRNTKN